MHDFQRFGSNGGNIATPSWVRDAVFYQIFPDRFAQSPQVFKPAGLEPWDSEPTSHGYKGGDLLGVVDQLDYIQDLGINALYLNPIFQSASNHRYHTHDYFQVDPLLGGNRAFDIMLRACHDRGIRVVLDGVFNHASRGFYQFNDILENGESSPYRDWFRIANYPPNAYDWTTPPGYDAWVGLHALPNFNTDNPDVREYIMGIGEHWIRQGIDGWRLDVPAEITTQGFWGEFRDRIKAINPQAYLCGEIWQDSSAWLRGDQFDAVMNYPFTEAILAFSGRDHVIADAGERRSYAFYPGIDARDYANRIEHLLGRYDWNVQLVQMNLLDSHDTARAISIFNGDQRSLELAWLLMFSFPGAPTVYYGDEIGLDGLLPDKWARKTFPWNSRETWNHELRAVCQRLIATRRAHPELRIGTYKTLIANPDLYIAERELGGRAALIVVNTGTSPQSSPLPGGRRGDGDPWTHVGEIASIATEGTLTVPARSGAIIPLHA